QSGGSAGRRRCSRRNQWCRHAPGWLAGKRVQATGLAPPRETTLTVNTTNRAPKLVASRARASGVLVPKATTQRNNGTKHVVPSIVCRLVPAVWAAGPHHAYSRCSTVATFCRNSGARKVATVRPPHERV